MRALRGAVVGLLCGALWPAPATAQLSPQFAAVSGAGLYASLGGNDFETTDDGIGAEGSLWFRMGDSWLLGGGVQYTSHHEDSFDTNIGVLGIFAEPRYRFTTGGGKPTPFVAGRLAWLRQSGSVAGTGFNATGFLLGGGGGVAIGLGTRVDLEVEVLLGLVSFGDVTVGGSTMPDTDTNGTALAARLGIAFRLGE